MSEYWVDITTTYKVYNASSEEEALEIIERYEDGDETVRGIVSIKDMSRQVEKGL